MDFIDVDGWQLEYDLLPGRYPEQPTLVFLHEGLGSLAMWQDFPTRVAEVTGCRALVWSRAGYGQSSPLLAARTPSYLHEEALRLPPLLAALGIMRPVLIGHSDGGSIALIYAATFPDSVPGIVVLAPHAFVEDKALAGIRRAGEAYAGSDWRQRLGRYHRDVDRVFYAWHDTWLSPEFRAWDITACLSKIGCPVLAIQGEDDEYATMRQIDCLFDAAPAVELCPLADCRHSPHRDQPQRVIAAIAGFVARLSGTGVDSLSLRAHRAGPTAGDAGS